MFLDGFGIYKDIVNVHQNSVIQQIVENVVYYGLEGGWCINKTYRYYPEFEKAVLVTEGGFLFLFFRYPNEIKS